MKNKKTALVIVAEKIADWGERETYYATPKEIKTLISAGAKVIKINHSNNDGTFAHEIEYDQKIFIASSVRAITIPTNHD